MSDPSGSDAGRTERTLELVGEVMCAALESYEDENTDRVGMSECPLV